MIHPGLSQQVEHDLRLWDLLIPQTELTLNLLRQARLDHTKSAWEAFSGPLNYDTMPLGPLGCEVISHKKNRHKKLVGLPWRAGLEYWCLPKTLQMPINHR